ncbi:unnamed protein product, partial [Rotaria sp. Silwood1]
KDLIYKANQVTLTCLQLINAERQNEMINIRFIRAVVESYITCTNFINNNVLTEVTDNARKSAELFARYCDIVLRKGFV